MIQQPGFPPAAIPLRDSARHTPTPSGYWAGTRVALIHGVTSFLQSLDPRYVPEYLQQPGQPDERPSFSVASGETSQGGPTTGFCQGLELAARLVSAHTLLPVEVSTLIGGGVNVSALTRLVHDTLEAPGSNSLSGSIVDIEDNETPDNIRDQPHQKTDQITGQKKDDRQPLTSTSYIGQPGKIAVTLGALSSIGMAAADSSTGSPAKTPRSVGDAETLFKIGRDDNYPISDTYLQTADIDARNQTQSIGSTNQPFTGQYDGQNHRIENLQHCFVQKLEDVGIISHLRFANAQINATETAGVVACEVSGRVSDIYVENSDVFTSGNNVYAGIGAGEIHKDGTVANTTAVNSSVTTSGNMTQAGIGGGHVIGTVEHATAVNSKVSTSGFFSNAGIGGGNVMGTVEHATAVNSTVTISGRLVHAGIGGGYVLGTVKYTTAVNSKVSISGNFSSAGIGAGGIYSTGTVANTTAVNSEVSISGAFSSAGIGAGGSSGTVANTTVVNSRVSTRGLEAHAAIGAGLNNGIVEHTTAVCSSVTTSGGDGARAGIGQGATHDRGSVANTLAKNSLVNEKLTNIGRITSSDLCEGADARVLTVNCQFTNAYLDFAKFSNAYLGSANSDACQVYEVTTPAIAGNTTAITGNTTEMAWNTLATAGNTPATAAKTPAIAGNRSVMAWNTPAMTGNPPATAVITPAAMAGTSVSSAGIAMGVLGGVVGFGIGMFLGYQWFTAYQEGQRGHSLVRRPFTRGRKLVGSAVQGIRERMNWLAVPVEQPAATPYEMRTISTERLL